MINRKLRVVCYVNQFFGQIGGEDMANVGFSIAEKPIGPAVLINSLLKDKGEVVGTIICGDNYFAENVDSATKKGIELVKELKPDIFFAGPAFNAGRYGIACGNMASQVAKELNIPTVTGMYPENPAVDIFRKDTYIIKTGILSAEMRKVVPKMVDIGLRLVSNEHVGSAKEEGYVIRDEIKNEIQSKNAARRAIEMVLHKIKGEPFESEILPPVFEKSNVAPGVLDLTKAKVAIVSDGGLIPVLNPDKLKPNSCLTWGKYNIDKLLKEDHFVIHSGYDGTWTMENPYRLIPYDALLELQKEGVIGEVDENAYITCGNCAAVSASKDMGKQIAESLKNQGVTCVILTST